jgi:hypothetical protein
MHFLGNGENRGVSTTYDMRGNRDKQGGLLEPVSDKYRQSIVDDISIEPKLFSTSINSWLAVLEVYLLWINTTGKYSPYILLGS